MKQLEWYKEILDTMKGLENYDQARVRMIESKIKDLENENKWV
mgnify:CR=1 FL=1